jgi:hypothetical protein
MRSTFDSRSGFVLVRTPSYRQQQLRRRLAVVSGLLALAFASALVGAASTPRPDPAARSATGPFSYFPSE